MPRLEAVVVLLGMWSDTWVYGSLMYFNELFLCSKICIFFFYC